MIYSPLIQNAISLAIKVHDRQQRKGKALPYITHPLVVGLIVSRVTSDEDVIAAAILHDTIEDCKPHGSVTKEVLADQFGERVARIVDDVSEKEKSLPWEKRKRQALQHIKSMDRDSLLVKGADVLHNMSELVEDVEREGDTVFARFNAPKDKQLERYRKLIEGFERVWPKHPLLPDLKLQLDRLLVYA